MKKYLLMLSLVLTCAVCLFVAACSAGKIQFSYVSDGVTQTVEVASGEEITLPTPDEKEGYSFEGWYLNEDFSGSPVEKIVAESSTTFYAKWEQLAKITLNLDGGSLSQTTLYLKAGENVYDFMADYQPTKSGLVFGAWFNGTSELSKNTRMPAAGLTLTAKYKVAYTIELYKQNMTLDGYEKDEQVVTDYGYIGAATVAEQSLTGFRAVNHADAVTSLTLSQNASDNVFKLYYDREEYSVTFIANMPDGSTVANRTVTAIYGQKVTLPLDYTAEGYCLVGWSTVANGEIAYEVDYVGYILNDKDESYVKDFQPERNIALYAVWSKGYTDLFGGGDYIYHFNDADDVVYLSRADVFFQGKYAVNTKTFYFYDTNNKIALSGILTDGGQFVYADSDRVDYTCYLYVVGTGLVNSTSIRFDAYNNIVLTELGEDGFNVTSKASFIIDEDGYYVATFTEGERAGETMVIQVFVASDNAQTIVFQIRNEEEARMGKLVKFVMNESSLSYYTSAYDLTLSGWGTAIYNSGTSTKTYSYSSEVVDGVYTITVVDFGVIRVMQDNGVWGYMLYDESLDITVTSEDGTLTLDGLYSGTYTVGNTTVSGYYTSSISALGGSIVHFTNAANGDSYTFVVSFTTKEVEGENGETEQVTEYSFEKKLSGYAEYHYYNGDGYIYFAPMIVLDDEEEGKASVYGYTSAGEYAKVSQGSYVIGQNGWYVYTADEFFNNEVSTSLFDLHTVKSFAFNVRTLNTSVSTSYDVAYWYSFTDTVNETEELFRQYESAKNGSLLLVAGLAVYNESGISYSGGYSTLSGYDNLIYFYSSAGYIFIEFDEDEGTFITLDSQPYTAYRLLVNGSESDTETLALDGKGGAVYTVDDQSYVGTITRSGDTTDLGYYIYIFESDDLTFNYILLSSSSAVYFSIYNQEYHGTYVSDDGRLTLDGYSFGATFVSADGENYSGLYYFNADNVVVFVSDNSYRYFDISGTSFKMRGSEYGIYLLVDNQAADGIYLKLDGYSHVSVFTLGETDEEDEEELEYIYIDESGTYSQDGDIFTVNYSDGATTITLVGKLSTITYSSYTLSTFVIIYKEFEQTYVNYDDLSILVLDDHGHATKYDTMGNVESGEYTIITDTLLYYVNEDATDAYVYLYDKAEGTAKPLSYSAKGYYTATLESLLFTKYGFAIFNGTTRYYYYVDSATGNVTIYLQDSERGNSYGYYAQSFGKFDETITWEDETYYYNDGFALTFMREEENKDTYPILSGSQSLVLENLQFTPSGEAEFSVSGTATVSGTRYTCYVTRTILEDGTVSTYVTVGNYYFDIELTYEGRDHCSYRVTGLSFSVVAPAYSYIYMYYLYYLYLGASAANAYENTIGIITIQTLFDEKGEVVEDYIEGSFGADSKMLDANGNVVAIKKSDYTYVNGQYIVEIAGEDGYDYKLYFSINTSFGINTYVVSSFVRVQKLVDDINGYSIDVERVITSDNRNYSAGTLFITLYHGDEELEATDIMFIGDMLYFIVREREDSASKINSSIYYKIDLKEVVNEGIGEEGNLVAPYESVTVTKEEMTVYYTADSGSFVEVNPANEVLLISYKAVVYTAVSCTYDAESKTYTVKTKNDKIFRITVTDSENEIVTITEVTE